MSDVDVAFSSTGVLFANLIFEGCDFAAANSNEDAIVRVVVDDCASTRPDDQLRLHHVDFRYNTLDENNAIRVPLSSCLSLELFDLGFENNNCSGPCIVFPSNQSSRLRDIRVLNITSSGEAVDTSAVFWGPPGSKINVTRLTAANNTIQIFSIEDGTLVLNHSKLTNNSATVGSPVHLRTKSNGTFENVSFAGNGATHSAGSLMSDDSAIRITNCAFEDGNSAEFGGFVDAEEHSNVTIRDSIFSRGQAKNGGCLRVHLSNLTLHNVMLRECHSVVDGAAMHLSNVTANITTATLDSNRAGDDGGCLYAEFSNVTGDDWAVKNNSAGDHAGGLRVRLRTYFSLANSVFVDNEADRGGAVSQELASVVNFTHVSFSGNVAATEGGAFYITSSTTILSSCTFNDSRADDGGILFARKMTTVNISSSIMRNGTARRGGCLLALDGSVRVANSTMENCTSKEDGGAMHLRNITAHISNSSFLSNSAEDSGGAVFADEKTHLEGGEWIVEDNSAGGDGGGVLLKQSTIQVKDSLFRNNSALHGGAVHQSSSSNGTFLNATMINNTCSRNGGAFFTVDSSRLNISNSKFRGGSAEDDGGFVAAISKSSVDLEHTNMTNGNATNGGAVFLSDSLFKGDHLNVTECSASSTGGGFSFESVNAAMLTVQLNHSIVQNNTARLGGEDPQPVSDAFDMFYQVACM